MSELDVFLYHPVSFVITTVGNELSHQITMRDAACIVSSSTKRPGMFTIEVAVLSLVFSSGPWATGHFYKTNITDFSRCKVHYSRSEGQYMDFFEIPDEAREVNSILDFHFSVLARSDAHILLAPSSQLDRNDPVYEIVLGAGGNTFSDIRRMQKSAVKTSARIKGLLSPVDIRSFWLHISKDGLIEIGRETEELAFLAWRDFDPLPLKVFSFSTWPGVEAKWFFDCPRDNITTDSKEVEPVLSDLQRLQRDLLTSYSSFVRPVADESDLTLVTINLIPQYVSLDEKKALLHFKGEAKLQWLDEKLVWTPSDYGGIDEMQLPSQLIWSPDLTVYNSLDPNSFYSKTVSFDNFGLVKCKVFVNLKSWCDASRLGTWPSDTHLCSLEFGFWRDIAGVQLKILNNESDFLHQYASEWLVTTVNTQVNYGWQRENQIDPAGLVMQFLLKRKSDVYKLIYYTPFLVIATTMLATFCVSPFGYLKITLACVQIILTSIILLHLGSVIPGHPTRVPNILTLYTSSLSGTVFAVAISIIVINVSRNEHSYRLPRILCAVLTSSLIQKLLLLPSIKSSKEYGKLTDVLIPAQHNSLQRMWILFGTAVDRVAFAAFLIFIIALFYINY